jgi:hypothetical protein
MANRSSPQSTWRSAVCHPSPTSRPPRCACRSAKKLLAEGLPPRDLLKGCGLDPTPLDALKAGYNPLEPRIPAGNGRGSGDWTTTDNTAIALPVSGKPEVKPATPAPAAVPYTPVHGLPDDAVVVTTPAGKTIPDPESKTKKLMAPPRADFHKACYGRYSDFDGADPISNSCDPSCRRSRRGLRLSKRSHDRIIS